MPSLQSENESFLEYLDYVEQDCTDLIGEYTEQYEYEQQDLY